MGYMTRIKERFTRKKLLHLQNGKCFYCDKKIFMHHEAMERGMPNCVATQDHFIPKHLGFNSLKGNLVLACSKCNRLKGNRLPSHEFVLKFHYLYENFEVDIGFDIENYFTYQRLINLIDLIIPPLGVLRYRR